MVGLGPEVSSGSVCRYIRVHRFYRRHVPVHYFKVPFQCYNGDFSDFSDSAERLQKKESSDSAGTFIRPEQMITAQQLIWTERKQ